MLPALLGSKRRRGFVAEVTSQRACAHLVCAPPWKASVRSLRKYASEGGCGVTRVARGVQASWVDRGHGQTPAALSSALDSNTASCSAHSRR